MRWSIVFIVVSCKSSESTQRRTPEADTANVQAPVGKAPDEMDERMRHCPLALDGATTTLENIEGGVRFTIKVPDALTREARRRAHHVVDFAAKKTRAGHGEFDAKGGGRMKNCPVVTDDVTITVSDVVSGAQLDVIVPSPRVEQLRHETRTRVDKFPFVGATITTLPDAPRAAQ